MWSGHKLIISGKYRTIINVWVRVRYQMTWIIPETEYEKLLRVHVRIPFRMCYCFTTMLCAYIITAPFCYYTFELIALFVSWLLRQSQPNPKTQSNVLCLECEIMVRKNVCPKRETGIFNQIHISLYQDWCNNKTVLCAWLWEQNKKRRSIGCLSTMWVFSIRPAITHSQQYDLSYFIIITICQLPHWLRLQLLHVYNTIWIWIWIWIMMRRKNDIEKQMLYQTKCQSKEEAKKLFIGGEFRSHNDRCI